MKYRLSTDALSLFLRNRAESVGEINEYDRLLMIEASERLDELEEELLRMKNGGNNK